MILGLGIDVCAVARMEEVLTRWGDRFAQRIVSPEEWPFIERRVDRAVAVAGRFAAKEALAKAMAGARGVGWHEARVLGGGKRPPRFDLIGRAAELCDAMGVQHVHLSLTHDAGVAAAVVILEGEPTGATWPS